MLADGSAVSHCGEGLDLANLFLGHDLWRSCCQLGHLDRWNLGMAVEQNLLGLSWEFVVGQKSMSGVVAPGAAEKETLDVAVVI